jgi:hypothetical protein
MAQDPRVAKPAPTSQRVGLKSKDGKTSPVEGGRTPKPGLRSLRVRALELIYYNHMRRREGDVFSLVNPEDFNERVMERVGQATPEQVTGAQAALDRESGQVREAKHGRGAKSVVDAIGADDDE